MLIEDLNIKQFFNVSFQSLRRICVRMGVVEYGYFRMLLLNNILFNKVYYLRYFILFQTEYSGYKVGSPLRSRRSTYALMVYKLHVKFNLLLFYRRKLS